MANLNPSDDITASSGLNLSSTGELNSSSRSNSSGALPGAKGPATFSKDNLPYAAFGPDQTGAFIIFGVAVFVLLAFTARRIWMRFSLRRPLRLTPDENGQMVVYRASTAGRIFGWPGMMLSKLSLTSFYRVGVPAGGSLAMILFWIGVSVFAVLIMSGFDLTRLSNRLG
jgi:hypothetical protein